MYTIEVGHEYAKMTDLSAKMIQQSEKCKAISSLKTKTKEFSQDSKIKNKRRELIMRAFTPCDSIFTSDTNVERTFTQRIIISNS